MKIAFILAGAFAICAVPLAADTVHGYSGHSNYQDARYQNLSISDDQLEANVRQKLKSTRLNKDFPHVKFRADNGTVTLTGFVDSQSDKMIIEDKVANTMGVKDINNKIRVYNELEDQSLQDIRARQKDSN